MDLKEAEILGDKIHGHWYYVSKGRAMRKFLGKITSDEVLDVGAGSGIFSRKLLDQDICNSAICVDPNYEKEKEELHNGKKIKFVKSIDKDSTKSDLRLYSGSFNKTLITIHDIERNSIFSFNKQFGLSVFCLCSKS